jgi:2-phosphosulfolactate phosphatase
MLNADAVVEHVRRHHRDETVLIVCSGSAGNVNLEDMVGAGYFADLFAQRLGAAGDLSDAALAARQLYLARDPLESFLECRVGRMMLDRDLRHEVEYATRRSEIALVPRLDEDRLRPV